MIKIIFLGTSQAIPTAKRNHTAVLMQYENESMLFDCGEGTQRQFRIARINPCKLTKIFISHWHGDHILGLPGLFQTLALNGYNKTLRIYGPKGTSKFVELMKSLFIFQDKLKTEIHEVSSGKIVETQDFFVEVFPLKHGTSCNAYSFVLKDKLRIDKKKLAKYKLPNSPLIKQLQDGKDILFDGKKIKASELTYKQKGKKISFVMDTALCENIHKAFKDSDLAIVESTYTEKEKEIAKKYMHLTASQAATVAKKNNVKKLILTHISQRYENNEKSILDEAKKIFKSTEIAHDFMKVEI